MEALSFYVFIIGIFFKGNYTYPSSYLEKIYNLKGIDTLYNLYYDNGFFDVNIISSNDTIVIKEGEKYRFAGIRLNGNYFFSSKHIQDILPQSNSPFSSNAIQKSIKHIMTLYQNNGFPFVSVKMRRVYLINKSVGFNLEIFEGPRCKIDNIKLKNTGITRITTIEKFLRIKRGVYFSKKNLENSLKRIGNLTFIKIDGYSIMYNGNGDIDIILNNKEYKSGQATGALGYKKNEGVTGLLSFGTENLLGTGRGLLFKWEKINQNKHQAYIKYYEPYFLNLPLNLNIALSQVFLDTTYAETNLESNITAFSHPFYTQLGIGGKEILLPQKNQHEKRYFFSSELGINSLFPKEMPKKGIMISGKRLWENVGITKIKGNLHLTIPIKHSLASYIKFRYEEVYGKNLNIGDSINVGGGDFLRGYVQGYFLTNEVFLATAGIRFFMGNFCFYPFSDYGRLIQIHRNIYSFGFGIFYQKTKITFAMHNRDILEGRIIVNIVTAL